MPRIEISVEEFGSFVADCRTNPEIAGFVTTAPHKARLAELADSLTERASTLARCNVVRRDPDGSLHGDMTDGLAAIVALRGSGVAVANKRIGLLGCGAAGRAIALAALSHGASEVCLQDLQHSFAEQARTMLTTATGADNVKVGWSGPIDVLVNATPVGSAPTDESPFADEALRAAEVVVDVVTRPTQLIERSRAHGLVAITGRDLAASQVDPILRHLRHPGATSEHGTSSNELP